MNAPCVLADQSTLCLGFGRWCPLGTQIFPSRVCILSLITIAPLQMNIGANAFWWPTTTSIYSEVPIIPACRWLEERGLKKEWWMMVRDEFQKLGGVGRVSTIFSLCPSLPLWYFFFFIPLRWVLYLRTDLSVCLSGHRSCVYSWGERGRRRERPPFSGLHACIGVCGQW